MKAGGLTQKRKNSNYMYSTKNINAMRQLTVTNHDSKV